MSSKLKQLTKDTAIYGISTIFGRFLNFILVPFYTNVFGTADYGVIANVYSFIALLNIVYIYGIDVAFLRYSTNVGEEECHKNYATAFFTVVLTSILLSLIILGTYPFYQNVIGLTKNYQYLIFYTVLIPFIDSITAVPFIYLRLKKKAKKFAGLKMVNILVNVFLNIVLVKTFKYGIEAVFISNLASSVLSLLLIYPDIIDTLKPVFSKTSCKTMLKFGLPLLPAGIAAMMVQVIDRPILQVLTNQETVGIYQANYKLGIFMMLYVSMFQYAWQPFLIANAKEKDSKTVISKVLTYFCLLGCFVLLFLTGFIKDLATFKILHRGSLIGQAFWGGLYIVPIVLVGYLFNGVYVVLSAGLMIKEKTKLIPVITGLGALINVVANFTLIPIYSIGGAAFATFASYFVMSIGMFFVNQKYYKINFEYRKLTFLFLLTILCISFFYIFENKHIATFITKLSIVLVFIGGTIFFRIIDVKNFKFLKM